MTLKKNCDKIYINFLFYKLLLKQKQTFIKLFKSFQFDNLSHQQQKLPKQT